MLIFLMDFDVGLNDLAFDLIFKDNQFFLVFPGFSCHFLREIVSHLPYLC